MSRYTFKLDTQKRQYLITDNEQEATLQFVQVPNDTFFDDLSDSDTDRLVDFANDLQEQLQNGYLILDIRDKNVIAFDNHNYPELRGSISLRNCLLSNPELQNVSLENVTVPCASKLVLKYSTIKDLEWQPSDSLHISYCFVNEKYNKITTHMSKTCNEWFMNERVDGEIW